MKFSVAWASVLNENNLLKVVSAVLTITSVVFSVALARLAVRQPILIDRECGTRYVTPVDPKHTNKEIDSFLKEVIPMRFDSNATDYKSLMSDEEASFRLKEQDELKKKGLSQRVLINLVKVDGNTYLVDADRILSAGKIRSALLFSLRAELVSVSRSVSNPYGLLLKRVSQVNEAGETK